MSNDITEIEKQFFDTFGIEPKTRIELIKIKETSYPQITDRRLLELICILNQVCVSDHGEVDYYVSSSYKNLKQEIISQCNSLANRNAILETNGEEFKHQVQALFKED